MTNLSNYNFYEVPQGENDSNKHKNIPRKYIVIVLAILLVIFLIVITLNIFRSNTPIKGNYIERAESTIDQCSGDNVCEINKISQLVDETRDASLCELLNEENRISCITRLAVDSSDESICLNIAKNERLSCLDEVYLEIAPNILDINICSKIDDEVIKELCGRSVARDLARIGNCSTAGDWNSVCRERLGLEAIPYTNDPNICDIYSGEIKDECIDLLGSLDQDGDGLLLGQELELGTDDKNVDTDGDGFDDYTEVQNGFNPLDE